MECRSGRYGPIWAAAQPRRPPLRLPRKRPRATETGCGLTRALRREHARGRRAPSTLDHRHRSDADLASAASTIEALGAAAIMLQANIDEVPEAAGGERPIRAHQMFYSGAHEVQAMKLRTSCRAAP